MNTYPIRLRSEHISLREFRLDDLDDALLVTADERGTQWLSFDSRSRGETAAMLDGIIDRAQANPRSEYYLAIAHSSNDRAVGFARLALEGVQAGQLGIAVAADYWRSGYAADANRTLIRFAFHELGLHRLTALIGPSNTGSIALIKRLGFIYEGQLRDHVFTNGAWRDSQLFSLLATAWRP